MMMRQNSQQWRFWRDNIIISMSIKPWQVKRSHCGLSRQKGAPVLRLPLPLRYRGCAPSCHAFCAPSPSVRPAPGLAKEVFKSRLPLCPPSLRCPFCPPPAVPPGLPFLILPSAGAPGEIKDEGAACWGSPSLGPSAALQGLRSGCRPSGQGGMAVRGGRPYVGATGYSHQRYTAGPATGE